MILPAGYGLNRGPFGAARRPMRSPGRFADRLLRFYGGAAA
jgi:hypothetical protein